MRYNSSPTYGNSRRPGVFLTGDYIGVGVRGHKIYHMDETKKDLKSKKDGIEGI